MKKKKNLSIGSKVWLEAGGLPVLGDGRLELLRAVAETGSLNLACAELDISYRHAWGLIKKMEERLGVKLLAPRTGGKGGGGSALTDEAEKIIASMDAIRKDVAEYVARKYGKFEIR